MFNRSENCSSYMTSEVKTLNVRVTEACCFEQPKSSYLVKNDGSGAEGVNRK